MRIGEKGKTGNPVGHTELRSEHPLSITDFELTGNGGVVNENEVKIEFAPGSSQGRECFSKFVLSMSKETCYEVC